MEDFDGNGSLSEEEDKARGTSDRQKKGGGSFKVNNDTATTTVGTHTAKSKRSFFQKLARTTARQPKKALLLSLAITVILSALGPLIYGGLNLTTGNKGWRSRGTFISNREMQAEVLNLNRYQLFRDTDGSHWKLLTETVMEGYIDFPDRSAAYADPELSSEATTISRRTTSVGVDASADMDNEINFLEDMNIESLETFKRSLAFEDTCDANWYKNATAVIFESDNVQAIWKVQPKDDDDAIVASSALDKNVLSQICNAEVNSMKIMKENKVCTTCSDGSCHPPHSLVFLLRQKMNMYDSSCADLMEEYTGPIQEEYTDELLTCSNEYSEKFNATTLTPGELEVCQLDYLPNVVDINFGKDGNRNIRYTTSFFPTTLSKDAGKTINDHNNDFLGYYKLFDGADGETVRGAYNFGRPDLALLEGEIASNADIIVAMASLLLTIVALLIHNKSPFLAFMGFLQIVAAVPLAYFGYTVLAQLEFFPLLNLVGLFVASAIGADDIFVAVDKWNNTRVASPGDATTEDIAEIALPDAAGSMLLTTITTSVAFFATCVCPITPILCFATYCGLLVFFNYVLNILIVFPSLCLWNTWQQNGSSSKFVDLRNKKKSPDKGDDETIVTYVHESTTKVEPKHRIMLYIFNTIDRFRWPLLVICLAATGVSTYVALQFPAPESMDVRLLPASHPLELHNKWKVNLSYVELWKPTQGVSFIFGLKSGDTGMKNNPDSLSKLLLDKTFDPSTEEAQIYLRDFCDTLFAKDIAIPLGQCVINEFENWLEVQSSSATPSSNYSDNCDAAVALPVPVGSFDPCIIAWSKETSNVSVLQENGKVRIIMVNVAIDLGIKSSLAEIATKWAAFEDFVTEHAALAPESANKFYHVAFLWWYWDGSVQMTKTALEAGLITLAFASTIVIFSSKSIILTVVSVGTIFFILTAASATLVGMGWELGYIECVCFSILIGFSCDFVIHFGHAYKHFEGNVDRRLRARFAVVDMGPSILAAAATTVAAAFVMTFCSTSFFIKFATILLTTMLYATLASFIFYVVLVDLFGSAEPTKLFDSCWNWIVGKKEGEEKEEEEKVVSARFPTGRPSLAPMPKSNRRSMKTTYGEIIPIAEMDKNGNQKVTRASLAESIKQTYESIMSSMRNLTSMKCNEKSGRLSPDLNANADIESS